MRNLLVFLSAINQKMEVVTDIYKYNGDGCVLTVGMFDGVHRGHQSLLEQLVAKSRELSLPSAIVTFWPHPKVVLAGEQVRLLNTLDEKLSHFAKSSIDRVFVLPFDRQLAQLTPQEFIDQYLVDKFRARYFLMGYNHHFGKGKYELDDYTGMATAAGLPSSRVDKFVLDGRKCSSSEIRKYIQNSDIETANELLGYLYTIGGTIIAGDKIGRQIGYRTANVLVDDQNKLLPPDGVYACYTYVDGTKYNSVVNIGLRPTFNGSDRRIETHILNFSDEIYGEKINVEFVKQIRKETHFQCIDELTTTIRNDIDVALRALK